MATNIIKLPSNKAGKERIFHLKDFNALEGWDIQQDYIEFVSSKDKKFRKDFTLRILSHAAIKINDVEVPLSTETLVINHLYSWQDIDILFKAILLLNSINPETHAQKQDYWSKVGSEMAVSFLAAVSTFVEPALKTMVSNVEKE